MIYLSKILWIAEMNLNPRTPSVSGSKLTTFPLNTFYVASFFLQILMADSGTICHGQLLCFNDILIEEHEVKDMISTAPVNKAFGPNCTHYFSRPLRMLFNISVRENSFPSYWKVAHVLHIFKKEGRSLPINYTPVSLLSCVSKAMERILFKHSQEQFFFINIKQVFFLVILPFSNY